MNGFNSEMFGAFVAVFGAIIGVAFLAVFLGKNSQTAQVLQAAGSAIGQDLAIAEGPVTGYVPATSYGSAGLSSGFNS